MRIRPVNWDPNGHVYTGDELWDEVSAAKTQDHMVIANSPNGSDSYSSDRGIV